MTRKYLTQDEVYRLMDAAQSMSFPERNRCLIMMAFIHGFRASELLDLRLSDIDASGKQLNIRRIKNGFSTTHPLLPDEYNLIKLWLKQRKLIENGVEGDWLFLSRKRRPISRQHLKWSTKTGHRVRVFSSIDFPIRLVVTHHYIRAVLVRCNIQRYSPLLRELHR